MNITIDSPKLLMVEGNDEKVFFQAYLAHLGIRDVQILDVGGKPKFRPEIKSLVALGLLEGLTHFAIIEDADNSAEDAFKKLTDLLKIMPNIGVPKQQDSWNAAAEIAGGAFVMTAPNQQKGALEDLCLATVQENPLMECVNTFSSCIETFYQKAPKKKAKVEAQAFSISEIKAEAYALAKTADERHLANRFYLSVQTKVWNFDHESLSPLRNFLKGFDTTA